MDDEELDDKVLEIELEQRQLNLDRKKLELRKLRAKLRGPVGLTFEAAHPQVKPEFTGGDDPSQKLSSPGSQVTPQRATDASVVGSAFVTADNFSSSQVQRSTPVTQQRLAELNNDGSDFSPKTPGFTPSAPSSASPMRELSQFSGRESLSTRTSLSTQKPNSQVSFPLKSASQSAEDQNSHRQHSTPFRARKRSLSPDTEESSTVEVKRTRPSVQNWQPTHDTANSKLSEDHSLSKDHKLELIRLYGRRLAHDHMVRVAQLSKAQKVLVTKLGSKFFDALVAKKYKTFAELHDDYACRIENLTDIDLRAALSVELDKFRRAVVDWWPECAKKPDQVKRREHVGIVFQDVKRGKYK